LAGQEAYGFATNETIPELIGNRLLPKFGDGTLKVGKNPEELDRVSYSFLYHMIQKANNP
jgi:hypothetical protein